MESHVWQSGSGLHAPEGRQTATRWWPTSMAAGRGDRYAGLGFTVTITRRRRHISATNSQNIWRLQTRAFVLAALRGAASGLFIQMRWLQIYLILSIYFIFLYVCKTTNLLEHRRQSRPHICCLRLIRLQEVCLCVGCARRRKSWQIARCSLTLQHFLCGQGMSHLRDNAETAVRSCEWRLQIVFLFTSVLLESLDVLHPVWSGWEVGGHDGAVVSTVTSQRGGCESPLMPRGFAAWSLHGFSAGTLNLVWLWAWMFVLQTEMLLWCFRTRETDGRSFECWIIWIMFE